MKRILLIIVFLLVSVRGFAQQQARTVTPPAFTSSLATQATPINLIGSGVNAHKFTWNTQGTVSAGACALQAGSNGTTFGTTLIAAQTVTSSGGPTTLTSGVYNYVLLNCTTPITGSGSVTITYTGYIDAPAGSSGVTSSVNVSQINGITPSQTTNGGLGTTTVACSGSTCYATPVAFGATVLAASTSQTVFASTTVIDEGSSCINQIASAAKLYVTDGNGVYLAQAFSIPANSLFSFRDYIGTIMAAGIKATSDTASAIVCRFRGKQ